MGQLFCLRLILDRTGLIVSSCGLCIRLGFGRIAGVRGKPVFLVGPDRWLSRSLAIAGLWKNSFRFLSPPVPGPSCLFLVPRLLERAPF